MNIAQSDLLFVYGSLRLGSGHPMARMLAESADHLGRAWVEGRLYRIDWYPGLVPSEGLGEQVGGDLFRMHAPARLLPVLDEYEECSPSFPQPREYRRELMPVHLGDGRHLAWIYVYNRPVLGHGPWP